MYLGKCLFSPLVKQNLGTDLTCATDSYSPQVDTTSVDSYHDTVPTT